MTSALQAGERELAVVRRSRLILFSSFGRLLGAVLTLGLSVFFARRTCVLVVTNRRLILRQGFLTRNVVEMELGRVAQVEITAGLFQRLFGIGALKIIALDQFHFALTPVSHPERLKDLVMAAAGEARGSMGMVNRGEGDSLSALERLGKLRESGVLSEEEFQRKKGELLSKI